MYFYLCYFVVFSVIFLFSLFIITAHRKLNEFITVADAPFYARLANGGLLFG